VNIDEDAARFVGLHASFPVEKNIRRVEILQRILTLENSLLFSKIKHGQTLGRIQTDRFTPSLMYDTIQSLSVGASDWLQLVPEQDAAWTKSYENAIFVSWNSSVIEPKGRPASPIETRFGQAGSLVVTYPLSRFTADSESPFQMKLVHLMKKLFVEQKMHWAFVHMGYRPLRPFSIGDDEAFLNTRGGFPLTSFDADLDGSSILFKEFVKGAVWANFLNDIHVSKLGGLDRILNVRPSNFIVELGTNGVLLQVGTSPLTNNQDQAVHDYQRLRTFLKPILLETPEDRQKLQMEILGSWRPPGVGMDWKPIRSA